MAIPFTTLAIMAIPQPIRSRPGTISTTSKRPNEPVNGRRQFRVSLPFRNLAEACAKTDAENWSFEVSAKAAEVSLLFSSWIDEVFQKLDLPRALIG